MQLIRPAISITFQQEKYLTSCHRLSLKWASSSLAGSIVPIAYHAIVKFFVWTKFFITSNWLKQKQNKNTSKINKNI